MHVEISSREAASIELNRDGANMFVKGFVSSVLGLSKVIGFESALTGITGKRSYKCGPNMQKVG